MISFGCHYRGFIGEVFSVSKILHLLHSLKIHGVTYSVFYNLELKGTQNCEVLKTAASLAPISLVNFIFFLVLWQLLDCYSFTIKYNVNCRIFLVETLYQIEGISFYSCCLTVFDQMGVEIFHMIFCISWYISTDV